MLIDEHLKCIMFLTLCIRMHVFCGKNNSTKDHDSLAYATTFLFDHLLTLLVLVKLFLASIRKLCNCLGSFSANMPGVVFIYLFIFFAKCPLATQECSNRVQPKTFLCSEQNVSTSQLT